jgi:hypothetical protein
VGLLGVLAASGTPIPGEVNVAVAILMLPINAVLNPFLYTLNVVKEKRKKASEERLLRQLEERIATAQLHQWVAESIIRKEDIDALLATNSA